MTATPRPGLRDVSPYVSPQLTVTARLNTNECPVPLPQGFADELADEIASLPLNRYPDGQMTRLREELATSVGHPFDGTWAANGSNEILTQLLQAYGGAGRLAAVFEPTYLLHSRIAWLTQTGVVSLSLDDGFTLSREAIATAIGANPDVVFVCSPNNPTGNAQTTDAVASLAGRTHALVIVDEAYIEFGGATCLPLVAEHPNVVITRTMSKAFALAGARIGYALGAPDVIDDLQRVRLPYHLSAITQAAGVAALRHAKEAMAILDAIRDERDRILAALRSLPGVTVYPSDANFVLFVPPKPAAEVWQGLVDRGVLIRDLSSVVPNALRVTAGPRTRSICSCPHSRRYSPHDRYPTHRFGGAHHQGDRRPRGADARRHGNRDRRHRTAVLRPHAAAARHALRVGPRGDVEGRPGGRRSSHGGGRRHRRGASAGRGVRATSEVSGGSPRSPCRSTRPRSRSRSTSRGGRSWSTRSRSPPR